jgi:hypothetical protein
MKEVADKLFNYLSDIIYDPANANLDIAELPPDLQEFGGGLQFFCECVVEVCAMALHLSRGNLEIYIPSSENEMAAPFKSLHASLKHLAWQTNQVASGDYKQRVAFMGEFADSFNIMVEQLAERQNKLEYEIKTTQKKSKSLLQSNLLFSSLIHYVPQRIYVVDMLTQDIVLMNDAAINELNIDRNYLVKVNLLRSELMTSDKTQEIELNYQADDRERKLLVKSFILDWNESNVEVIIINDISTSAIKITYNTTPDSLSIYNNREQGIETLKNWISENRNFSLILINLEHIKKEQNLSYNEIRNYLINENYTSDPFIKESNLSLLRNDEIMLLAPFTDYHTALEKINHFFKLLNSSDKLYYGIVTIEKFSLLNITDILSMADMRMKTKMSSR